MKYGKRIVRKAIDTFPYEKIEGREKDELRKELLILIKNLEIRKEGIFGDLGRWKIKIHFVLGYIKISYLPEYPSRKHRIYYRNG